MPGPAPKPDAQRRRRNAPMANTVRLPAEGRRGRLPVWPLLEPASVDEAEVWADLWGTPQSAQWERLGWTRVVARYCRLLVLAEATTTAGLLLEVRQLEDRLGLTPMAMLRLRWEVVADEVADKRGEQQVSGAASKRRLRAVEGGSGDAVAGS